MILVKSWKKRSINFTLRETRRNTVDRVTKIKLNNKNNTFKLVQNRDGHQIKYVISRKSIKIFLDGKMPTDTSLIRQFRLHEERVKTVQDYYTYLYGLPMKTLDKGTIISEEFTDFEFANQKKNISHSS